MTIENQRLTWSLVRILKNKNNNIMPDLNVVKIEGKPIEKLIEVISKGIGTIYKPRAIRREAVRNTKASLRSPRN